MMDPCFMRVLILTIFAAYVCSLSEIEQHPNYQKLPFDSCGVSMSDRIVGGKESRLGQYPWLARLGYSFTNCPVSRLTPLYKCGGSLITDLYVITAAHCAVTKLNHICAQTGINETVTLSHVLLGEHNVDQQIDCEGAVCADPPQLFNAVNIYYYASYNNPALKYDIALIKLNKRAIFTGWVRPICLPVGEMLLKSYIGQKAEVAGWGISDIKKQVPSSVLLYVQVPIVDNLYCIKKFSEHATITETELCAGGKTGEDSCAGDSGGPLMLISSHMGPPKYYLLGVVSFGASECGAVDTPAIYTNVPQYMKWILDNIDF